MSQPIKDDVASSVRTEATSDDDLSKMAKGMANRYWLCECGVARVDISSIEEHCSNKNHMAEKVTSDGERIGFLAVHFEDSKYKTQVPGNAMIKREKLKNDPMFPHTDESVCKYI